ncbi:hypothetical protein HDU96_002254 [Phlyctochytrium bullatum]|nr:hypothetical protein HDU96_002254 [Phlyctochytrium bullatum]
MPRGLGASRRIFSNNSPLQETIFAVSSKDAGAPAVINDLNPGIAFNASNEVQMKTHGNVTYVYLVVINGENGAANIKCIRVEILKRLQRDGMFKLFFISRPTSADLCNGINLMRQVVDKLLIDVDGVPFNVIINATQAGEQEQVLSPFLRETGLLYHFHRPGDQEDRDSLIAFVTTANTICANREEQRLRGLRTELSEAIGAIGTESRKIAEVANAAANGLEKLRENVAVLQRFHERINSIDQAKVALEAQIRQMLEELRRKIDDIRTGLAKTVLHNHERFGGTEARMSATLDTLNSVLSAHQDRVDSIDAMQGMVTSLKSRVESIEVTHAALERQLRRGIVADEIHVFGRENVPVNLYSVAALTPGGANLLGSLATVQYIKMEPGQGKGVGEAWEIFMSQLLSASHKGCNILTTAAPSRLSRVKFYLRDAGMISRIRVINRLDGWRDRIVGGGVQLYLNGHLQWESPRFADESDVFTFNVVSE